jgi:hypothetical protein
MSDPAPIRPRDRDTIIQALSAGVVPRTGLQHIQVGRALEVGAAVQDIARIADGGSAFRLIIGEYGAGKTFFLHLVRTIALEKRLVTVHADLGPDRRLFARGGEARNLYQETVRNLATRAKPDGGALQSIVERFIAETSKAARDANTPVDAMIQQQLVGLQDHIGGYDYATVLTAYCRGHEQGEETLKSDALRWLRGEFTTKTDARKALGVRTIVDDESVYDHLKLLAAFTRLAGYEGLLMVIDEMVNLYKMQQAASRNQNYEQILRVLNDVLQGSVSGLGVYFGGTPEFLMDTRRGLYSYPALQSRLGENQFARDGLVDFSGPVIRLSNLTPEDLHVLLENVRRVFASGNGTLPEVPDAAIAAFMQHCNKQVGDAYFRTPRNSVRAFVQLLSVLEQNPAVTWPNLLGQVEVAPDETAGTPPSGDDDELSGFKL